MRRWDGYGWLASLWLLLPWLQLTSQADFLFRSSPGRVDQTEAGLWGGDLDLSDDGYGGDLFDVGYDRISTSGHELRGLNIAGVSYDPYSRQIITEIDKDEERGKIVALANPCTPSTGLQVLTDGATLSSTTNPYLADETCGWKCGWNAFAYHDSKVYFVLSAVFGQQLAQLTRKIQVRVFKSCDHPSTGSGYDILGCSDLVATLYEHTFEWPQPKLYVWVGSAMNVVKSSRDRSVQLYIQLFNKTNVGVSMNLLQIQLNSDNEHVRTTQLHSSVVPSAYSGNWQVRGLGEIAHRDGVMCWTAAEDLYCGELVEGQDGAESRLDGVTKVIESGEAYAAGICTGDVSTQPKGRVLTGLAIAKTKDPFAVYFGCFAEEPGVGGLGLLRLSAGYTGLKRELLPVSSAGVKVYGGALFLVDNYYETCNDGVTPTDEPEEPGSPTTRGAGCSCPVYGGASQFSPLSFITFLTFAYLVLSITLSALR